MNNLHKAHNVYFNKARHVTFYTDDYGPHTNEAKTLEGLTRHYIKFLLYSSS